VSTAKETVHASNGPNHPSFDNHTKIGYLKGQANTESA
jgi:hypothetical protein